MWLNTSQVILNTTPMLLMIYQKLLPFRWSIPWPYFVITTVLSSSPICGMQTTWNLQLILNYFYCQIILLSLVKTHYIFFNFLISSGTDSSFKVDSVVKRTQSTTYDQWTQLFTRLNFMKATMLVSSLQIILTVNNVLPCMILSDFGTL